MAVKVRILNLKKVMDRLKSLFDEDLRNSELLTGISDFAVLRIQAETRKGNDLSRSESITGAVKQPPLSPAYERFRKNLADGKVSPDHPWWFDPDSTFMRPEKSNLTATGQMLDSLKGKVSKADAEIIISPTGARDSNRQNDTAIKTNIALTKDLASRGRTYLGLDKLGVQRIRKMILDEVRRFKRRRGF